MSFFARLFNRRAGHQPIQRSATAPLEHVACTARDTGSDDDDSGPALPPWPRRAVCESTAPRRAGADLRRSQTFSAAGLDVHLTALATARQSLSSSCDGSMDDQLRQLYGKVKPVHRGRTAMIMEGLDRATKRRVTIKAFSKLNMSASKREKMEKEIAVLQMTKECSGIVRMLNQLEDLMNKYLVLENVPGCTLIELMANNGGRVQEARCVVEVVQPLLQALEALHGLGIVHRDIKPEHILCACGTVKLVDFYESAQLKQKCLNHRVGQLEYMAPEVLSKPSAEEIFHQVLYHGMSESELPQYNEKVDVWSAGCVIYEALTGLQPFMAETREELYRMHTQLSEQRAANGCPGMLDNGNLSPLARQFLSDALQPDPLTRPSVEQLLRHPWITKYSSSSNNTHWLLSPGHTPLTSIPSVIRIPETGSSKSSMEHIISRQPIDLSVG